MKVEMAQLPVSTRVVWFSDTGPEAGVVKWTGLLPGASKRDDITIGIEFVSIYMLMLLFKIHM